MSRLRATRVGCGERLAAIDELSPVGSTSTHGQGESSVANAQRGRLSRVIATFLCSLVTLRWLAERTVDPFLPHLVLRA